MWRGYTTQWEASVEHVAATTEPFVLSARDGGVATITLNRGDRFNPLSSAMIAALQRGARRRSPRTAMSAWSFWRPPAAGSQPATI